MGLLASFLANEKSESAPATVATSATFPRSLNQQGPSFQWTASDLFDVTPDCHTGGLIWFLNGEDLLALGPEHGVTKSGRVFDRMTRAEWINPCRDEVGVK